MGSTHETPGRFAPGESGVVGVFGMDLEGLEVVRGCSKRFIWKLTDISMNSCVDLLSPPAWWCGLKLWSEWSWRGPGSHHLRGGVDWNCYGIVDYYNRVGHHLRGGVDWNVGYNKRETDTKCHHLRGGVDWNHGRIDITVSQDGHHLRGGVDWNFNRAYTFGVNLCHHLRGGVDWNRNMRNVVESEVSSPPAWWCGLKSLYHIIIFLSRLSPPAWWCGLKSLPWCLHSPWLMLPPNVTETEKMLLFCCDYNKILRIQLWWGLQL